MRAITASLENISFNPRSRGGSDTANLLIVLYDLLFQSTLPRGERRAGTGSGNNQFEFQSTLPRGERLKPSVIFIQVKSVSIHAPAGGATCGGYKQRR